MAKKPVKKPPKGELSRKQKLFCDAYRANADGNGSRAAKAAGYSAPSVAACRLMKLPQVRDYLSTPLKSMNVATPEEVMQYLSTTMRNGDNSNRDRLSAAKQLQNCYGMNLVKYDVDVKADTKSTSLNVNLSLLSEEQLREWLALVELVERSDDVPTKQIEGTVEGRASETGAKQLQ